MRFAAGITLYNPTKEQLERVNRLSVSFHHIYGFDNSEPGYKKPEIEMQENVTMITEGINKGLPYAYNAIVRECGDYDFLCTLDQDSVFEQEDIKKITEKIELLKDVEDIGIVAPFIDYGHGECEIWDGMEKKPWVITSGSFVNLGVFRNYHLKYDENYFIDKFEIDMCQQMLQIGKKVMMYHGAVLHQQLGEQSGHRHPNHSVLRHYYLFRNRFYYNKKWYRPIKRTLLNILQTARHLYLIVAYEEKKLNKVSILRKAITDYSNRRFGKWEGCMRQG